MKKTLEIDEALLNEARLVTGARTDSEAVTLGLEALVRRRCTNRLKRLRGTEPPATDIPRRRRRSARKPGVNHE